MEAPQADHIRPFGQASVARPLLIPSVEWTTVTENHSGVVTGKSIRKSLFKEGGVV